MKRVAGEYLQVLVLLTNILDLVGHVELVGIRVAASLAHVLNRLQAKLAVLLQKMT